MMDCGKIEPYYTPIWRHPVEQKFRRVKCVIYRSIWDKEKGKYIKDEKQHEGNFHQWGYDVLEDEIGFSSVSIAIVELDDGKIVTPFAKNVEFIKEKE